MSIGIIIDIESANSADILNVGGGIMTIFLIIIFIISLLLVNTKYWKKIVLDTLDIYRRSLLLVFLTIVIFKIVMAL